MIKEKNKYFADIAIPPGETLLETIDSLDMSQADLARRMGMSRKTINEIIKGVAPITSETAVKLENVLGAPASFWINLEANYQEAIARINQEKAINDEIEIESEIPYAEMARLGWIDKTRNKKEKILNLRNFFAVSSLKLIPDTIEVAFRKSDRETVSPYALAAWLRKGEIEAANISTCYFNKDKLVKLIPKIRILTKQEPEIFIRKLSELLSDCGVALVVEQHLSKTYVNGATKWLNKNKVLLQLSLRCSFADIFWFSVFHELGHIIKHGKKEVFLEKSKCMISNKLEKEADEFASNTLIPNKDYKIFIKNEGYKHENDIKKFADSLDIAPFVVVGRLQHDGFLGYNQYSNLRPRFCFDE